MNRNVIILMVLAALLAGTACAWHPCAVYGTERGTAEGNLYEPTDVEVDSSGYVYVLERYNGRIQKFSNITNASIDTYGKAGSGEPGELDSPQALALRQEGNLTQILVADTYNHRVQSLTIHLNGTTVVTNWSAFGERCYTDCSSKGVYFEAPMGVAADSERIVVGNTGNYRIDSFASKQLNRTPTWANLSSCNGSGTTGGTFEGVRGVAAANDRIYAVDSEKSDVRVFSAEGAELLAFGQNGSGTYDFWSPSGIDADADGNIYVADTNNGRIVVYDHDGVYFTEIGSTNCTTRIMEEPNNLALTQFCRPEGVKVHNGKIYVADTGNHRVLAYDLPDGMPTWLCETVGDYDPCGEVTLSEVIDMINKWSAGDATLSEAVALINMWAAA